MKKIFTLYVLLLAGLLQAQERVVTWNIAATTEGQWNMCNGKTGWTNLVAADLGVRLWRGALFDVSLLSVYGVETAVADDRMGFSNIVAENKGVRLFHAGLSQTFFDDALTAFVGLKAADEDYFNTPLAGLFTGSAYGGMPTVTENHAVAVYPEAALALHLEYSRGNWTLRETLYNGAPSDRVDEQFRFCPGSNGFFNIGSVMYACDCEEFAPASYTLGYAFTTKKAHGRSEFTLWSSVEQPLFRIGGSRLSAIAQGSGHFAGDAACKGFWAGALVVEDIAVEGGRLGLAVNRVYCTDGHETDVELTFDCPVGCGFSLQPAMHFIRTDGKSAVVGLLRLCYEIGG